jgi:hypothetical protein
VEQEAGPLLVDTQSTKRKRAESLDERSTEPHEKNRKLRSTIVSEPGQIKVNGSKFSSLETELHDLIFEELEIKDVLSLSLTTRARHEQDVKEEWKDVSEEVAKEIASIWESEYGGDWRRIITGEKRD